MSLAWDADRGRELSVGPGRGPPSAWGGPCWRLLRIGTRLSVSAGNYLNRSALIACGSGFLWGSFLSRLLLLFIYTPPNKKHVLSCMGY